MYAYSPDSAHLVFHDGFGQTRVSFGKKHKAKTDKKELASPFAGLVSINRAGDRVLTHRDRWRKTTLWELPSMKAVERFPQYDKDEAVLHPDGTHLMFWRWDGPKLALEAYPGGEETEFALSREGDVAFPADVWLDAPCPLVTGKDGSFAALGKGTVVSGFLREGSVDITDHKKLELSGSVQLFASPDGAAVVAHHGRTSTVYTPAGGVYTLETLLPAQVGGGFVAWQPDEATIVRRPLEGGDEERFALEGDDAGAAFLYPGEGRLCVMPWHREELLDLLGGQRVSRKLKAAEAEGRRALVEYIRPYVVVARELGARLEFPVFKIDADRMGFYRDAVGAFGDHTLRSWMFQRILGSHGLHRDGRTEEERSRWTPGLGCGLLADGRLTELTELEVDDEKVREAAEWLTSRGVPMLEGHAFRFGDRVGEETLEWLTSLSA